MPSTTQSLCSKISIIIPVYRGGHAFRRCLESVETFGALAHEVIIVVDGEDAESEAIATAFGHKSRRLAVNAGPAKARNFGARQASGDILFFLDADVALGAQTIYQIQVAFENSSLDALIGSYDDAPGAPNFLSQYKNLLHHYTHQCARGQASTFWGACGAIRRSVFASIGGFDENYRTPSIEDIELGYRLTRHGYRIDLNKNVQVKHLKRWGIRSLLKADFFYRALPWTQLIWRDRNFVNDLNLDTSSRLSVVSVYLMVGLMLVSPWYPALAIPSLAFGALLLFLNASIYRFFWQKRSFGFALKVVPWHWLYYAYSGIAFVIGTCQYWSQQQFPLVVPSVNVLSVSQRDR
jgi:glycosyltransferase involved in cell wall biosynthesis